MSYKEIKTISSFQATAIGFALFMTVIFIIGIFQVAGDKSSATEDQFLLTPSIGTPSVDVGTPQIEIATPDISS